MEGPDRPDPPTFAMPVVGRRYGDLPGLAAYGLRPTPPMAITSDGIAAAPGSGRH